MEFQKRFLINFKDYMNKNLEQYLKKFLGKLVGIRQKIKESLRNLRKNF